MYVSTGRWTEIVRCFPGIRPRRARNVRVFLFLTMKGCPGFGGRWEQLNEGVEKLEEPDAVFSLVKHHFQDFLESFAYTLRDTQEHPEYTYLSLHWEIENVSRLNRHPDQERCEELTKSLKSAARAEKSS